MKHEFVEHVPEQLEPGVLYISIEFGTAVHACACGCGVEVVTPLSPAEWAITYDGKSVSLYPSIGNWGFPCKSHYWIRKGRVDWSTRFTDDKIEAVRNKDKADLDRLFRAEAATQKKAELRVAPLEPASEKPAVGFLAWLKSVI